MWVCTRRAVWGVCVPGGVLWGVCVPGGVLWGVCVPGGVLWGGCVPGGLCERLDKNSRSLWDPVVADL